MGKGAKGSYKHRQKVRKIACAALTVFLVIVIIILVALYFSLYRPKDPKVQVAMYNPNRATFHVRDQSTACLYYYGTQVGFTAVPTGPIPAHSFVTLSIALSVQGSAPLQGGQFYGDVAAGILQVTTAVAIFGKVTTLNIFTHHASVVSKCSVNVSLNARSIVSYTCQRTYSVDA